MDELNGVDTYTGISALKRKGIIAHVTTQISLDDIIVS